MHPKTWALLVPLVVFLAVDQATKVAARNVAAIAREGGMTVIPGLLDFAAVENPGAAFSFLESLPAYVRLPILLGFTVVAIGIVISLYRGLRPSDWIGSGALGMVLAGAFGNGIDRVVKGQVTDFVAVRLDWVPLEAWVRSTAGVAEWPTFNVADVVLGVGIVLFFGTWARDWLDRWRRGGDNPSPTAEEAES